MSEWKEYKLGEILSFHYGKALKTENRIDGKYPVYSSAGITGCHDTPLINSEALIVGRKGTIGKVYYTKIPFWCIDTAYYILPDNNKRYCLKYVYYLLQTIGLDLLNEDSAVPGLNRDTAYSQIIKLPPLPEQQAIASILSSLDNKIDLLHQQNITLEKLAETLFRQWFIEEAKPEWEVGSLGDVVSIKGGTTPSTKDVSFWNGSVYWATPRDLSNHGSVFLFDTERKITQRGLLEIGSGLLPVGTVLMSSRAPIGYLAISAIPVAINQGYIGIICDKLFSNNFMYLWCKNNMDKIKNSGNGSVFQEISKSVFKQIEILIPSSELLSQFDVSIKPIFEKIRVNQLQIKKLTTLRDTLLPKLMSEEIKTF